MYSQTKLNYACERWANNSQTPDLEGPAILAAACVSCLDGAYIHKMIVKKFWKLIC